MFRTILILLLLALASAQQIQPAPGIIQTKRIAFGGSNAMVFNSTRSAFALSFSRTFSTIPRIGLAVYTIDFQYSPTFSCSVTNDITSTSAVLQVTTSNVGQNNKLFLMYMATDHPSLGIFMPKALVTDNLNLRLQQNQQSFRFNYRQQILTNSLLANIRVSVYLTGISMTSELTNNGYSVNRTYFNMFATKLQLPFYNITVQVQSMFGDITIAQVEYTIVYFDITTMNSTTTPAARYLMDSGKAVYQQFGGVSTPTPQATTLASLPTNTAYENLFIFYGIAGIDCTRGASIAISAYPTVYNNSNINQFILNAQTWKLTYVSFANYEYIQYQTLKCNLPLSNCDAGCSISSQPHFILNGICQFCHYSCLTCSQAASTTACDTCDVTRTLSPITGLCDCRSGFNDPVQNNYTCFSCFPCETCSLNSQLCLTCNSSLNMVKNSVLSICECTLGYFSNYQINTTNFDPTQPCLPCPPHCLLCTNASFCLACDLTTYLTAGSCFAICGSNQIYQNGVCNSSSSSLFDQTGRLGYDFTYLTNQSVINFTLTFSQPNVLFYYYQNQTGYSSSNSFSSQSQSSSSTFFFDDGNQAISGFKTTTASQNVPSISIAAISGNNSFALANNQQFDFSLIKTSDINGSYIGISQQYYYYLAYYFYQQRTGTQARYTDRYGIPYGKVHLSSTPATVNPHFAGALSSNMILTIGNDTIQYQTIAVSNSLFYITAALPRSYYGETATLTMKNAGLVRSNQVASQLVAVGHPVYIYVCNIPSDVSLANSLFDSNSIIVQVLWGLGKYPLFIGLGWVFMPLMLVLMSIMNLNYIDTQRPLNLHLFLASFADFRNPSILYNPLRNDMDSSIFTHPDIYRPIPAFQRFDRGLDFMKNCFQFFFVPFLAVILLVIFVLFNKILNRVCKRDIPFISQYLQPRFPLLIGAYTLVQALPVAFFFFAQLNDTKFSHPNQPSSSYPVFNIAMSYLAFFLTCAIPLALMAFIYHRETNKQTTFRTGSQLILVFNDLIQSLPFKSDRAYITDPLWTQQPTRTLSYGFALSVFYLFIFYGFITSFFYNNYPWQLTGLILATALFGFFAFKNDAFDSVIIKAFWVLFSILMLAFLFLLAAIGSNVSTAPCGLQNLGYLAIGFLYALILLALIASLYLLWLTLYNIYATYCKGKPFIVNLQDTKIQPGQRDAQRHKSMKTMKSRMMSKSGFSQYGGSRANIGPNYVNNQPLPADDNPDTGNRLREEQNQEDNDDNAVATRQRLKYSSTDKDTGDYFFVSDRSKKKYRFGPEQGQHLYNYTRIYVDPSGQIYDSQNRYLDRYQGDIIDVPSHSSRPFMHFAPQQQVQSDNNINMQTRRQVLQTQTHIDNDSDHSRNSAKVVVINRYIYNGEEYQKMRDHSNGQMVMRNISTGRVVMINPNQLRAVEQRQFEDKLEEEEEEDQNVVVNVQKREEITQIIDSGLARDIDNNQVSFSKDRKLKIGDTEHIKMSQDGNIIRLYNTNTKKIERVSEEQYLQRCLDSLNYRLNLNGRDYDVREDGNRTYLLDTQNNRQLDITNRHLNILRQQNQQYIRNGGSNKQIIAATNSREYFKNQEHGLVRGNRDNYEHSSGNGSYKTNIINNSLGNNYNVNTINQTGKDYSVNSINNSNSANNNYNLNSINNSNRSQTINRAIVNHHRPQPTSQEHLRVQEPHSTSYANNMLLLQSKATHNLPQSNRKIQQVSNRHIEQQQPTRHVHYQQQIINHPGSKQVRTSQQSITEYRTTDLRNPSAQHIQMQQIQKRQSVSSPRKQISIEQQQLRPEDDPDTVEYIVAHSVGPFQMYVMAKHDVKEVDDEDIYDKDRNIFRQIIFGHDVMNFMQNTENKHKGCVIFMVDLSTKEQYRIN